MELRYEDSVPLLRRTASKVVRRLKAAGARCVLFEDVMGELQIAWCLARDSFDPDRKVPFAPFLQRGCYQHINRWIETEMRQLNLAPFELDYENGNEEAGEDSIAFVEMIPDANVIPADEFLEQQDFMREVRERIEGLSPLARTFVDLIENPPQFLTDAVAALLQRSEYARGRGIHASRSPGSLTGSLVLEFMGVTRAERTKIYSEIAALSRGISQ